MSTQSLSYKYDANPTKENKEELKKHFEIHKNIYNKALETLNKSDNWIKKYEMYNNLPKWKKTSNPEFQNVHSKAAQQTVGRIYNAIKSLNTKKEKGEKVGKLRYKNSINSIEYSQSGYKINQEEGYIYLSKIGEIPVNFHRPVPEGGEVKGVIIKEYSCGDWKIILQLEIEKSDKKPITEDSEIIGIDLNVSNFLVDSEGREIQDLKNLLEKKYERIKKEQKKLSRKEKGSNNWKKQKKRGWQKHTRN
ncbi:MAG: IS605 OrfB-like transposable element containing RNAse H-like and Zn finger domain [Candidatus Methanohalarchaeum thermophilum]|uniref:IS605 OrfB-like transposable element containing RNAse H-like and Zn finger domain n=1 Tax=Methanohalarchaeum thermophilum TaxID=1903181 RepID=A0A1Q6DSZ1_METT1|nr:MAG: IS605 OrfB-like transposable element containing RNAse H-like and Zn finger domain [Candidatus Methanohalarchaeum thermophilum]